MKRLVLLLSLMAVASGPASSQVMMHSDAESELTQAIEPPGAVIDLIIRNEQDSVDQLKECLSGNEHGAIRFAELFAARVIRLNNDDLPDYFVRPALKPYCGAFYGAHMFRYWFVTSHRQQGKIGYRIVFKSGGDEVRMLGNTTHGYHDLELVGHNAVKVATSTWRFNGKKYVATGCVLRNVDPDDKRTSRC